MWAAAVDPPITDTADLKGRLPSFPQDFTYGEGAECVADNTRRAGFAAVGLLAYADRVRDNDEDFGTIISDFMGDLMHLADLLGVDFDEQLDRSRVHYEAELRGAI